MCEVKRARIRVANAGNDGDDGEATSGTFRYGIFAQADFILHLTADGQMSTIV